MDLSAMADVSARVAEIRQRVASPWSFASVLGQVSQGAAPLAITVTALKYVLVAWRTLVTVKPPEPGTSLRTTPYSVVV